MTDPAGPEDDEAADQGARKDIGTSGDARTDSAPGLTEEESARTPRRGVAGTLADASTETGVEPEGRVPSDAPQTRR